MLHLLTAGLRSECTVYSYGKWTLKHCYWTYKEPTRAQVLNPQLFDLERMRGSEKRVWWQSNRPEGNDSDGGGWGGGWGWCSPTSMFGFTASSSVRLPPTPPAALLPLESPLLRSSPSSCLYPHHSEQDLSLRGRNRVYQWCTGCAKSSVTNLLSSPKVHPSSSLVLYAWTPAHLNWLIVTKGIFEISWKLRERSLFFYTMSKRFCAVIE